MNPVKYLEGQEQFTPDNSPETDETLVPMAKALCGRLFDQVVADRWIKYTQGLFDLQLTTHLRMVFLCKNRYVTPSSPVSPNPDNSVTIESSWVTYYLSRSSTDFWAKMKELEQRIHRKTDESDVLNTNP